MLTAGILAVIAVAVLFVALIAAIVAYQARQRGYSFVPWLIAGMLSNPIFFLVLLAVMPDFARKARRRQYRSELETKLAERAKPSQWVPRTAGQSATLSPECSLGDLPTVEPRERSLGDEETRL
jgi:flagellar biosynthesis protein FliQ